MTAYRTRAVNTATESRNRIHSDDVARAHGFRGGLVPGVVDYAYLTHPVVERWGVGWLERGTLAARFLKPLYDGDEVVVELDAAGALELRNGDGELCATGSASAAGASGGEPLADGEPVEQPPPAASAENFRRRPWFAALRGAVAAAEAAGYLDRIGEGLPLYRERRLVHPGQLLGFANDILMANFTLGPWIHTESSVANLGTLGWEEPFAVRAQVAGLGERRGHELVELDVGITGEDERPVARIRHHAIYRLRSAVS